MIDFEKPENCNINILGSIYRLIFCEMDDNKDGETDFTTGKIKIRSNNDNSVGNFEELQKQIIRHEIIHAFMFESGLGFNWEHNQYGHEETVVDWFAIQYPKIKNVFDELGV